MKNKLKNIITTIVFAIFTLFITVSCILSPVKLHSLSERRELAQFPEVTTESVLNGDFSSAFESYTTDRFPKREFFRTIKTFIARNLFGKLDNNGLFITDGHISKLDSAESEKMMNHSAERFSYIYEKYLTGKKVYFSIVPDKNLFLAKPNGYPSLDYKNFAYKMSSKLDFMTYIDISDLLSADDYYKTDTHWKQENLSDIADRLSNSMGTELTHNYKVNTLKIPFYGVYAGQYAGAVKPDTIKYFTSDIINSAIVTYNDGMSPTAKEGPMYNMEKAEGADPYEMFLSGTMPVITLENPKADTEKELLLFRDSFGSSIAPMFLSGYSKVTLIDVRYVKCEFLNYFVDFDKDADVLFLYSATLLNNSLAIQ